MTRSLIVASEYRQADLTADIDWRWRRRRRGWYEMPNGEEAKIVTTGDEMRGILKADVYLAYGWWKLPERDRHLLDVLTGMGRFTIKEPQIGDRSSA